MQRFPKRDKRKSPSLSRTIPHITLKPRGVPRKTKGVNLHFLGKAAHQRDVPVTIFSLLLLNLAIPALASVADRKEELSRKSFSEYRTWGTDSNDLPLCNGLHLPRKQAPCCSEANCEHSLSLYSCSVILLSKKFLRTSWSSDVLEI